MKRIACLWFPNWSIQRVTAFRPELKRAAVLIATERGRRGETLWARNELARRRGAHIGMPLCEARSLVQNCRQVHVETFQPAADRQRLEQLAGECERYSPCVGLEEAEYPECLLLDVTGLARLFKGELSLANRIVHDWAAQNWIVHVAISDSIGSAWAAAHFLARPNEPVLMPAGNLVDLLPLPIAGLRLPEPDTKIFYRLGITSIEQVLKLRRASLASRFSAQTLLRLRQFTGEQEELIIPCQPAPVFQASFALETGIVQREVLRQIWDRLLAQLNKSLHARHRAVRELQCQWTTENKTQHAITLRLCDSVTDLRPLGELLELKLERVRLTGPIVEVCLEATETCPREWLQHEFLSEDSPGSVRQLSRLLNRLSSRLGDDAVTRPALRPSPIPERAFVQMPVTGSKEMHALADNRLLPTDRPTGLLPEPTPVEVTGVVPDGPPAVLFLQGKRLAIARQRGPERIESGWWDGPYVQRDYYQVETVEGQRYWLFRQLSDGHWYLHGMML